MGTVLHMSNRTTAKRKGSCECIVFVHQTVSCNPELLQNLETATHKTAVRSSDGHAILLNRPTQFGAKH